MVRNRPARELRSSVGVATLVLAEAKNPSIRFVMSYDSNCLMNPESFLVERELLASFFDSMASPKYQIGTERLKCEFASYEEAIGRYEMLMRNWKAEEVYRHPKILGWSSP